MKPAIIMQKTQWSGNPGYLLRDQQRVELTDLNQEATALAAKIQENFEGLGI